MMKGGCYEVTGGTPRRGVQNESVSKYLLFAFASLLVFLTGCKHKPLCYPEAEEVQVVIDWRNAPDAEPGRMTGFFYPVSGGEEIRYDFPTKEGGKVMLNAGRYRFVTFNLGTDVLRFRGEKKYETLESFTSRTTALSGALQKMRAPAAYETMPFGLSPEPLYAGRVYDVQVERRREGDPVQQVVVYPEQEVIEITLEVLGVTNMEQLQGASAGLSGVASSYFMGLDELGPESINVPIPLEWGDGEMHGKAYAYGISPDQLNELTLFVVMQDGKGYYYTYDVTKQVDAQTGRVRVVIRLTDGLDLPESDISQSGSAFTFEIESWEGVEIELPMS